MTNYPLGGWKDGGTLDTLDLDDMMTDTTSSFVTQKYANDTLLCSVLQANCEFEFSDLNSSTWLKDLYRV